jgi:hypothetical protein
MVAALGSNRTEAMLWAAAAKKNVNVGGGWW